MCVKSTGIIDSIILPQYGKCGKCFYKDMPTYSLPVSIHHAPKGTKAFSLTLIDWDAVPLIGFPYIHWILTNLKCTELKANESSHNKDLIQGVNSFASRLTKNPLTPEEASRYGGMAPPNKPHRYTLTIYAQSCLLPLKNGFYINELYKCLENNTISTTSLTGIYYSDCKCYETKE